MKIIAAQFTVILDDEDTPEEDLEKLLEDFGFAGPIDVTSLPDTKDGNVLHISFEPADDK